MGLPDDQPTQNAHHHRAVRFGRDICWPPSDMRHSPSSFTCFGIVVLIVMTSDCRARRAK